MRPTQLCTQCVHNLLIWEHLGKPYHMPQVSSRETRTEFFSQLCRQRRHNLLTVLCTLLLEDVLPDALTHAPIEQNQHRVDLPRYVLACFDDQYVGIWDLPIDPKWDLC